ncbi:hypothetical protein A2U01_0056834, partial [Trifolium medium]|nr:hypothetical protein [Trifolium medium]
MTRLVSRFPLYWTREHFDKPTEYYLTKEESMSSEELAGLEKLQAYVNGFVPARWVNRAGDPVLDAKGNEGWRNGLLIPRNCSAVRALPRSKFAW